jgi:hypothetical protein
MVFKEMFIVLNKPKRVNTNCCVGTNLVGKRATIMLVLRHIFGDASVEQLTLVRMELMKEVSQSFLTCELIRMGLEPKVEFHGSFLGSIFQCILQHIFLPPPLAGHHLWQYLWQLKWCSSTALADLRNCFQVLFKN